MPRRSITAIATSASVALVAAGFYVYATTDGAHHGGHGYRLDAMFLSANGLNVGADVDLAGVTVGQVSTITLDAANATARVSFTIDDSLRLPVDSRLSIGSSGLTAGNSLSVTPGHSTTMLAPGAMVTSTCELTSLEDQVSQYIFGTGGAGTDCNG